MKVAGACASALLLTGCTDWLEGAAKLTLASHDVTWPGTILVVGVCASLAYVLGKVFS